MPITICYSELSPHSQKRSFFFLASYFASSLPAAASSASQPLFHTPASWRLLLSFISVTGCVVAVLLASCHSWCLSPGGCSNFPQTGRLTQHLPLILWKTGRSSIKVPADPVSGKAPLPRAMAIDHHLAVSFHARQSGGSGLFLLLRGHSSPQRGPTLMTSTQPNYLAKAYLQITSFWGLGLQHRDLERGRHRYSIHNR